MLADLKFVQELNEGVNRMFADMALAGLPEPGLDQSDSGFKVTLFFTAQPSRDAMSSEWDTAAIRFIMRELNENGRATVARTAAGTGLSTLTVRRYFQRLADAGIVERVARSATDPQAYWILQSPDTDD